MGNGAGTRWLNPFDVRIELLLNHFAEHHTRLDRLVRLAGGTPLSFVVIVSLMWLVLFDRNRPGQLREGSELLLGSAFFAVLATLIARVLALSLPFRARPVATASLHVQFRPVGVVMNWSSFPSDHATLFFALAAGLLMVSRRVGWLAVAWVALIICFPLVYTGAHWPTDVLAGAALGASLVQFSRIPAIREVVRRSTTEWHRNRPGLFFAVLFLFSYGVVTLFDDVRHILKFVLHSV
jgi:undecaprenyl-diphosphatase